MVRGENFFRRVGEGPLKESKEPCIFISHCRKDRDHARLLAQALQALSIDIYFDEHDEALQEASMQRDHHTMVHCIEQGLQHSTHLLGLITQNTKNSWWVPYEIGGAMARNKECAYLVLRDIAEVPAYIRIQKLLLDQRDLAEWVASMAGRSKDELMDQLKKHSSKNGFDQLLPCLRKAEELSFYDC